jgi:hypothetical protein
MGCYQNMNHTLTVIRGLDALIPNKARYKNLVVFSHLKPLMTSSFSHVMLFLLTLIITGSINVMYSSPVNSIFYPDFTCVVGNQITCP